MKNKVSKIENGKKKGRKWAERGWKGDSKEKGVILPEYADTFLVSHCI